MTMRALHSTALIAAVLGAPLPGSAGEADVVAVRAVCNASATCTFHVTVRHADTGWDHYANGWEVLGPDGAVIATRVLRHPHVGEQPFTRSKPGVRIPDGVTRVRVRATDSKHETGGAEMEVEIPRSGGSAEGVSPDS